MILYGMLSGRRECMFQNRIGTGIGAVHFPGMGDTLCSCHRSGSDGYRESDSTAERISCHGEVHIQRQVSHLHCPGFCHGNIVCIDPEISQSVGTRGGKSVREGFRSGNSLRHTILAGQGPCSGQTFSTACDSHVYGQSLAHHGLDSLTFHIEGDFKRNTGRIHCP